MYQAPRIVSTGAGPALVIQEARDHDRTIPLSAIAAFRELLGYDDPVEAIEAIVHCIETDEPPIDAETGENVWSQPYRVLEAREYAREAAAVEAENEYCDKAEIIARSEKAAYTAVHEPIDGGECLMDRCRRAARDALGCAEPSRKCGAETRTQAAVMPEKPSRLARVFQPEQSRRAMLHESIEANLQVLRECTQTFLHDLSDHDPDYDPLADPKPERPQPPTLDEIKQKHGAPS